MIPAQAIGRGLDFLAARQDRDGAWRDFDLPRVGVADAWTTAYVARCVRKAAHAITHRAGLAVEAATQFLQCNRSRGGGWSYNAGCPPDADSTAQALLLLGHAHPRDASALARFQASDGGFRTYLWPLDDDPWAQSQPEVTATALRALLPWLTPQHRIMQRGFSWLRRSTVQGARSYWWTSSAYTELELLRLRMAMPYASAISNADTPTTSFEAALVLECAILSRASPRDCEAAYASLLARQCHDGGWPAGRILRVPHFSAGNAIFEDERRLFTTATVLSALSSHHTGGVS